MSGLNQDDQYIQRECDLCGDAYFIYIGGMYQCRQHYKKYLENAMGCELGDRSKMPVQSDGQMLLFTAQEL